MKHALLAMSVLVSSSVAAGPDYEERVLANGLTVLVVENHALPLVTVEIGVRNGSMNETPELNGLSHLYEHMFFKGNQVVPNQEAFLQKTRALGMVFNGSTETECVNYYFTTSSDFFRPSLQLMHDCIEHPLFDPAELEREKEVVVGEIDRAESDPFFHFGREMDLRLWKYPSYKDPLGTRRSVLAATTELMRLIQERYYVPNNSVLVIAGDVEPAKAFAAAEALFADWPRAPDPFVAFPIVKEPPLVESSVVLVTQPVQSVALAFQWHGPSAGPGATAPELRAGFAADVLSTIVAQPASRFQHDLIESGACVRADFGWFTQAHVGPVSYGLEAAPGKEDVCLKAALAELPRLAETDFFSDQELANALTQLEMHKALERESISGYSHLLTFYWSSTGLAYYQDYLPQLRSVTRPDIDAFMRRYVYGKPFVFGALLSPDQQKIGLTEEHFRKLLGLTVSSPKNRKKP
jgi:zinc protease